MWTLIPVSFLSGLAALWAFGRLSNQRAIQETKRRIAARLYELRLFVDEPKLIWQAQTALLRDNFRYLALTLIPAVAIGIPMYFVLSWLDGVYGYEPLKPGNPALVTVHLGPQLRPDDPPPTLTLPDGFVQDSGPVRAYSREEVTWRVRPVRPAVGTLRIVTTTLKTYESRISAQPGLQTFRPTAPVEIGYPVADTPWLVWFFVISGGTAFLFRRKFGLHF